MANEKLRHFLAGYGVKRVRYITEVSKQSAQTLRNWHRKDSKQSLILCCVLAYRLRRNEHRSLWAKFDNQGFIRLSDYLDKVGVDVKRLESVSNQSYQTLSNWFANPKKAHMIGVILDAIKWIDAGGNTKPCVGSVKAFGLETAMKNRKSFKARYY